MSLWTCPLLLDVFDRNASPPDKVMNAFSVSPLFVCTYYRFVQSRVLDLFELLRTFLAKHFSISPCLNDEGDFTSSSIDRVIRALLDVVSRHAMEQVKPESRCR